MTEAIIVAIVGGVLTLIGTISSNHMTHSKTMYRIEQLEQKVEKHNNLIERMYCCENSINILDERIKDAQGDISEVKRRLDSGKVSNGNIA